MNSNDAVKDDDYFLMRTKGRYYTIWQWMHWVNIAAIRLH
jgi:hypothetical protein